MRNVCSAPCKINLAININYLIIIYTFNKMKIFNRIYYLNGEYDRGEALYMTRSEYDDLTQDDFLFIFDVIMIDEGNNVWTKVTPQQ